MSHSFEVFLNWYYIFNIFISMYDGLKNKQLFLLHYTGPSISWYPPLHKKSSNGGFCRTKVLLPSCHRSCWQQLVHLDNGENARVFLNSANTSTCTVSTPPVSITHVEVMMVIMPSVLWHCWLVEGRHPACKNWVVRCWHGYLFEARCKWFAYGPADATTTHHLLLH